MTKINTFLEFQLSSAKMTAMQNFNAAKSWRFICKYLHLQLSYLKMPQISGYSKCIMNTALIRLLLNCLLVYCTMNL